MVGREARVGGGLTRSRGRYMTVAQCAQQMLDIEEEKKEGGMYRLLLPPSTTIY